MTFNPFKQGSKRHDIVERMNKGHSYAKIEKDLKLKKKDSIYAAKTALNAKIKLKSIADQAKKDTPPEYGAQGGSSDSTKAPVIPSRIVGGGPQGTTVQIEGFATGKRINLTSNNITMIQWFMSKYNWEGDLSDFMNQCVEDFFRSRNWRIEIVQREVLP